MIKLLALYTFGTTQGTIDLSGIWETVAVRGMDSYSPEWELRRVLSIAIESPVGETMKLPARLLHMFAKKIDRTALAGTPIT